MQIDRIELKNYRGFEDCIIDFHPNINVFIGSNASGKTTILKSIVKSIYSLTSQFVASSESSKELTLSEDDINYKSEFLTIRSTISNFPNYSKKIELRIEEGILNDDILSRKTYFENEKRDFRMWFNNSIKTTIPEIPIIKFYPANRGSISYVNRSRNALLHTTQMETWANIYQDEISYSSFFQWFFENETSELRLQRNSNDFGIESPKLKNVRTALYKAFEKLNFGNYILLSEQIERKGSSKLIPTLVLRNRDSGQEEILDNLSEGQKAIIILIADIAYNLSLSNNFDTNSNFLDSEGIVIIDEVETHLHPRWQREILPILLDVFPKIQFFVATHSPQIISSVESQNVFICDNFQVNHVNLKTKGEDTNSLLKHIFDASERPKPYIKLINKFNTLIETNADYKSIEKVIEEVKELYNQDKANSISNLIDELNIKLSAYQFEKEYDKD